jgi:hypothetical protein
MLSWISREGYGTATKISTKIGLEQARETIISPILSHRISTRCYVRPILELSFRSEMMAMYFNMESNADDLSSGHLNWNKRIKNLKLWKENVCSEILPPFV